MVKLWKAKGDVLEFHKDPHDVAHVVPNLVALFLSLTPSDGGMGDTTGIGGTCNTYDTSGVGIQCGCLISLDAGEGGKLCRSTAIVGIILVTNAVVIEHVREMHEIGKGKEPYSNTTVVAGHLGNMIEHE
ncbi:hypothetical protein JHK85_001521 [Glycine max]|nr:hypothetical protein JHK85_001521 [Glycine max]KAG5088867.1 hypothetical protein JHK86_001479 [Glycine max]